MKPSALIPALLLQLVLELHLAVQLLLQLVDPLLQVLQLNTDKSTFSHLDRQTHVSHGEKGGEEKKKQLADAVCSSTYVTLVFLCRAATFVAGLGGGGGPAQQAVQREHISSDDGVSSSE